MQDSLSPAQRRERFRRLLDRPRVPLTPRAVGSASGAISIEKGSFASEAKERVPFLLYRPASAKKPLPAVLVLHGTGGSKERERELLMRLARRGFVAIAIDGRYHGERVPGGAHGTKEYNDAIFAAYEKPGAHPLYFDTVWDVWRTVDFLQGHSAVDPKRIGVVGFSKGGIETWLAAAGDERISVAVPAIAVQSLAWSLENNKWQARANTVKEAHLAVAKTLGKKEIDAEVCRALWNKVLPGILGEFDCPQMLTAIAPRPLLVLSGENDPNCPLEGAKRAFAAAEGAYRGTKALKIDVARGVAHQVTATQNDLLVDWLVQHLSPEPADSRCYELRVYTAAEGKLDALHARFRNHTLKLFEKHGITNIGYWTPVENPERKLYYVVAFPSPDARTAAWKAFGADPAWQAAFKESEKDGRLVTKVESTLLHTTDFSPVIKTLKAPVVELRTYTATPGNLGRLQSRFRQHTLKLFEKHGMTNLAYWAPDEGQKDAESLLIYLMGYPSTPAREAAWSAFRTDPAWVDARTGSEKEAGGSLTVPNGVQSVLLTPTDYSPQ